MRARVQVKDNNRSPSAGSIPRLPPPPSGSSSAPPRPPNPSPKPHQSITMGGSGSPSAAAHVADTRGEDAPCEEEPGNDEEKYQHEQPVYFPEELVGNWLSFSCLGLYYCYKISLRGCFNQTTAPTDIILAVKCDMGPEFLCNSFNLGGVEVTVEYVRIIHLNQEQVIFARRFQTTILSLLITNDHSEVRDAIKYFHELQVSVGVVYLLLPLVSGKIDWCSIKFSTSRVYEATEKDMRHCHSCKHANVLQTEDGSFCRCMLQNSVVYTPHNGKFYYVTGFRDLNANTPLYLKDGSVVSNKRYSKTRGLFMVRNFLHKCYQEVKEPSNQNAVEWPPELYRVVMAPVSANTLFSFSFVPSIMYRIKCLLLSVKLKIQLGPRMQQFNITALKILEALTTKECQEEFSLESLETLGDSFLKYVTSQHLFSKNKLHREGMLTSLRKKMVSNTTLCQLACNSKLVGYIQGEEFNPKNWIIPGLGYDTCGNSKFFFLYTNNMYSLKKISIKSKRIADTVESLIGAYLSVGGEQAAFHFIKSLGMDIELHTEMQDELKNITKSEEFKAFINVRRLDLETMLDYSFNDCSLLFEALTHGSSNIAATTSCCYERLEFLGDAVLDHILTLYFYKQYYPECTPALLTNLRKASVNNYCYAHAAVKNGLHKHIHHSSSEQMIKNLENSGRSFLGPSHGWEPGIGLPEHLADLIESIAGAIYLDSKHDKEKVWTAMERLLGPLATPETVKPDPVMELKELCERRKYPEPSYSLTRDDGVGVTRVVAEVEASGTVHSRTGKGRNKDVAKVLAANALLKELKAAAVS
ncbi:endoribonuclease Dicer homolog 2a-like isoform X2 [Phragmites australis]|uniref:endoribonuclease Dicer homolog 2a-like isoform X2 n=1 Tax=Phragmites australis TaxID=29695 RepID=UPI002D78B72B|nr:endoribonuclease Dicer homolog 2a-like isoform X2 [Phragmites australis]